METTFSKSLALLILTLSLAPPASAPAEEPDPHAHHHVQNQSGSGVQRSQSDLAVPDVRLTREDGAQVSLPAELNDGKPVFLNFIYTSCTTICPMTSQVFSMLQRKLGRDIDNVNLLSISIDPEQDTPARLSEYAQRFNAGKHWHHYTGTMAASIEAQRAFGVYRGDKMSHTPVTLVRMAPGKPWIRLEGFATADQLYAEFLAGKVSATSAAAPHDG